MTTIDITSTNIVLYGAEFQNIHEHPASFYIADTSEAITYLYGDAIWQIRSIRISPDKDRHKIDTQTKLHIIYCSIWTDIM